MIFKKKMTFPTFTLTPIGEGDDSTNIERTRSLLRRRLLPFRVGVGSKKLSRRLVLSFKRELEIFKNRANPA